MQPTTSLPSRTSSLDIEARSGLVDELLAHARFTPQSNESQIARRGLFALIEDLNESHATKPKIDKTTIDILIARIDEKISAQINEILHEPSFQALESAWRGLKHLVDRVDFRENIRVQMLNASKEDLLEDFEDAPEIAKSGLYRLVYSSEFGTFGGQPYGMICANYDFGPGPEDLDLLGNCAAISAVAHAPFIANAGPAFFGEESFHALPKLQDLDALFEGPQYKNWHAFRESEDARNVGLCLPRFLLRLPYGDNGTTVRRFDFQEDCQGHHQRYLWGHSSIAFATRVADSFAKYRWCPNIIGPSSGGTVENLPLHQFEAMGEVQTKIPTEIQITDQREFELSQAGFISMMYRKQSNNACFFSANSVQKPKYFGDTPEGRLATTNHRLGTQLPYMFIITRLAHYIKVLQREQLGSWKERSDLERELNGWLRQYVADMENPSPAIRSKKPLREASIAVLDVPGQPGWYRCQIRVRPHFKYMGADFSLSLVGKIEA